MQSMAVFFLSSMSYNSEHVMERYGFISLNTSEIRTAMLECKMSSLSKKWIRCMYWKNRFHC